MGGDRLDNLSRSSATLQTLLNCVRQRDRDTGQREGTATAEAQRVKELKRELKDVRRTTEIFKLVIAFCAQAELDRWLK